MTALNLAPKENFRIASDGAKIYDCRERSVEDVLKNKPSHRRILKDWGRNTLPPLNKFSYCALELCDFLTLPHHTYKLTTKDKSMLSSPIPKVATNEELEALLFSWFELFNRWLFGNTLSSTTLVVESPSSQKVMGLGRIATGLGNYTQETNTIAVVAYDEVAFKELKELLGDKFLGSSEELKLGTLLHGMVNAFISQYSCQLSCCNIVGHPSLGGSGSSGHGPAWADSVTYLAEILRQTVEWQVEVGLKTNVRKSMALDRFQPSKKQLERWGLDAKVWGHIDNWDYQRKLILQRTTV